MKTLPKQLFQLLSLHSPSGQEEKVIKYVVPILKTLMDSVSLDHYGNVMGEVRCGSDPHTLLLSAHMDTVARVQPIPYWGKDYTILTRSKGALGGDDKCGIAAILAILRNLKDTRFQGTVKVLFSREEELGCIGAAQAVKLNPEWFKDINYAVVIDRRGSDNIVNGSWSERFCSKKYAEFWRDMAQLIGFSAKIQDGSISDTMIFAEMGINSVNLSAGYYNAHTPQEYIKVAELKRIVSWVLKAMSHIQDQSFPEFDYIDPVVGSRWGKYDLAGWSNYTRKEDVLLDEEEYCDYCWCTAPEEKMHMTAGGDYVCPECAPFLKETLYPVKLIREFAEVDDDEGELGGE